MRVFLLMLLACDCSASAPEAEAPQRRRAQQPRAEWLKGQLHMHTGFSGDSRTPPEDALAWYAAHDFDFVVVTDHNHVTVGQNHGDMLVLPGAELTQNVRRCLPASQLADHCPLHVNALVVDPRHEGFVHLRAFGIPARRDVFTDSIERARRLGGIAQLNHPNYQYGADAALLTELASRGLRLFEVANEAVDSNNDGGSEPSTMELWDAVLRRGHRLWGTATDDAHHYNDAETVRRSGGIAHVGNRGWVVVHAARDPAAIRNALRDGRFYSSNGVELAALDVSEDVLRIETEHEHTFELISQGRAIHEARGTRVRFELSALSPGEYVRAVIRDEEGRSAWTQPAFRE
ncbi:MAG: CehA/McbA family metallohydrolase [Myxococcota bacterium]